MQGGGMGSYLSFRPVITPLLLSFTMNLACVNETDYLILQGSQHTIRRMGEYN